MSKAKGWFSCCSMNAFSLGGAGVLVGVAKIMVCISQGALSNLLDAKV